MKDKKIMGRFFFGFGKKKKRKGSIACRFVDKKKEGKQWAGRVRCVSNVHTKGSKERVSNAVWIFKTNMSRVELLGKW